jgi:hypothetical protein
MMHGHEKSDPAIVAVKPANKAEPVEPRAGTKGNAGQQTTPWVQSQTSMPHALERIRKVARQRKKEKFILRPWPSDRFAVTHPRWEPYAGKPHVRFCAGGAQ